MKKAILLIAFVLCSSISANCSDQRTISVSGSGQVTFVPDMVTLTISVSNTNPTLNESLLQTKETVSTVLTTCKKHGIEESDIKTGYVITEKAYRYLNNGDEVFKGYSAKQSVQITYHNLSNFEVFSKDLLSLKIKSIEEARFSHSKLSQYVAEANLLALDDARISAEQLVRRAGEKMGNIMSISNTGEPDIENFSVRIRSFNKSLTSGVNMQAGILSISAYIKAVYEIK